MHTSEPRECQGKGAQRQFIPHQQHHTAQYTTTTNSPQHIGSEAQPDAAQSSPSGFSRHKYWGCWLHRAQETTQAWVLQPSLWTFQSARWQPTLQYATRRHRLHRLKSGGSVGAAAGQAGLWQADGRAAVRDSGPKDDTPAVSSGAWRVWDRDACAFVSVYVCVGGGDARTASGRRSTSRPDAKQWHRALQPQRSTQTHRLHCQSVQADPALTTT